MNARQRLLVVVAPLMLLSASLNSARGETKFNLEVPGEPEARSTAVSRDGRIIIEDASGKVFTYVRQARADSPDRQYLGYYCKSANQLMQFPRAGSGAMYFSDGDKIDWLLSDMRVEKIGGVVAKRPARKPDTSTKVEVTPDGKVTVTTDRERVEPRVIVKEGLVDVQIEEADVAPISMAFKNTNKDEILVVLDDPAGQTKPIKINVKPGRSANQKLSLPKRRAEVKTYVVIDPATGEASKKKTSRQLVNEQPLRVSVYLNAVTSKSYDSTSGKRVLVEEHATLRSIGAFQITLDSETPTGQVVDAFEDAAAEGNPGAVRKVR